MRFVGLDFEGSQLQYHRNPQVVDHSKRSRFWRNLARPIDQKNKGKYRDGLGERSVEIFESVAAAEMEAVTAALSLRCHEQCQRAEGRHHGGAFAWRATWRRILLSLPWAAPRYRCRRVRRPWPRPLEDGRLLLQPRTLLLNLTLGVTMTVI